MSPVSPELVGRFFSTEPPATLSTTVPRYLVKQQSRCPCEGIFQMRLAFKPVNIDSSYGWDSSNQLKALRKRKQSWKREFCLQAAFGLKLQAQLFLGSPACWPALQIAEWPAPQSCESESHSVVSDSLQPHGLYSPWNSAGQSTGVGKLSLLQGTFPTQESNPGLPHCREILYQPSHNRSYASQNGHKINK